MGNKTIADISLVTAGVSSPIWIQSLDIYLSICLLVLGITLTIIRIYKELKKHKASE